MATLIGTTLLSPALLKLVKVRVEGTTVAVPVALCAVRVEKLRPIEVFLSQRFKALPGDMYYPDSGLEGYAAEAAVGAVKAAGATAGLFMVVIAMDSSVKMASSGTAMRSDRC